VTLILLNVFSMFTHTCWQNCGIRHKSYRHLACSYVKLKRRLPGSSGRGTFFRVPHTVKKKNKGFWGRPDVKTKCRTLLLYRTWIQSRRDGEITAEWLRYWNLQTHIGKPAPCRGDSKKAEILTYIRHGQGICRTPQVRGSPSNFQSESI
jgi:hypothetical protein